MSKTSKINEESYLDAVRKTLSISDIDIGKELGIDRSNVYRFRKRTPGLDVKANEILADLGDVSFSKKIKRWENFFELPTIKEWYNTLINIRRVSKNKSVVYIKSFWHVCKEIKMHPRKPDLEECAKLCIEMKNLYYDGEKQPRGLSYLTMREGLRSFFTLMKGISSEYLSGIGITKETLPTYGRYSKQMVSKEIRKRFEEILKKYASDYNEYLELLYIAKYMFYTATRIDATLSFSFKNNVYRLSNEVFMFEVIDKGRYGGKKWDKYLIEHALIEFKDYFRKRFNIKGDIINELPKRTDCIFPLMKDKNDKVRNIFKKVLIESGLTYDQFPPTHIWRHTFAQEFLRASNWNYELCAILGGWTSTDVLKRAYGEMGYDPKIDGLRSAMGVEIKIEKKELRW